ncbi:hypothetical protein [Fluviibacterium sp. S390]|uniref:hypothetical protein n=1 Tax=Fluviibacterium sp. S390 TaxID=3415139 RepID=UPI003C7BD011
MTFVQAAIAATVMMCASPSSAMTVKWPGGAADPKMETFTSNDLGKATIPDAKSVTYSTRSC